MRVLLLVPATQYTGPHMFLLLDDAKPLRKPLPFQMSTIMITMITRTVFQEMLKKSNISFYKICLWLSPNILAGCCSFCMTHTCFRWTGLDCMMVRHNWFQANIHMTLRTTRPIELHWIEIVSVKWDMSILQNDLKDITIRGPSQYKDTVLPV